MKKLYRTALLASIFLLIAPSAAGQIENKIKLDTTFFRDKPPIIGEVDVVRTLNETLLYQGETGNSYKVEVMGEEELIYERWVPLQFSEPGQSVNATNPQDNYTEKLWLPFDPDARTVRFTRDGQTVAQVEIDNPSTESSENSSSGVGTVVMYLVIFLAAAGLVAYLWKNVEVERHGR